MEEKYLANFDLYKCHLTQNDRIISFSFKIHGATLIKCVTNVPFLCTLTYFTFLIYLDYCRNPYLAIYYVQDDFVLKYGKCQLSGGRHVCLLSLASLVYN